MPIPVGAIVGGGVSLGRSLFGKRKRSSCRTISGGDVDAFRAGTIAKHVLAERADDIFAATGTYGLPNWGPAGSYQPGVKTWGLSVQQLADLHMNSFVPLCQQMEGEKLTTDPNAGDGLAMYNNARAAWKDQIRSGRIATFAPAMGGSGGSDADPLPYGVPGGLVGPPAERPPALAGLSGTTGLVLGAAALLLLMRRS